MWGAQGGVLGNDPIILTQKTIIFPYVVSDGSGDLSFLKSISSFWGNGWVGFCEVGVVENFLFLIHYSKRAKCAKIAVHGSGGTATVDDAQMENAVGIA